MTRLPPADLARCARAAECSRAETCARAMPVHVPARRDWIVMWTSFAPVETGEACWNWIDRGPWAPPGVTDAP